MGCTAASTSDTGCARAARKAGPACDVSTLDRFEERGATGVVREQERISARETYSRAGGNNLRRGTRRKCAENEVKFWWLVDLSRYRGVRKLTEIRTEKSESGRTGRRGERRARRVGSAMHKPATSQERSRRLERGCESVMRTSWQKQFRCQWCWMWLWQMCLEIG